MTTDTKALPPVTHAEARGILSRFNNSHFRSQRNGETARYSIPARPEYDDDLRMEQYIKQNELEIASVYGDIVERDQLKGQMRMFPDQWDELMTTGVNRTGCMFCMFGAQCEKAPNRFQRMKETHPRQYAYCMKHVDEGGLGLKKVLEYIGVPYE